MFLLTFLLLLYALLLLFYSWAWETMPTYRVTTGHVCATSVAIVIPARNEAHTINTCLTGIVAQDFGLDRLQIIVVDDHSTDATVDVVRQFAAQHPQVKLDLLQLADFVPDNVSLNSYKKKAITIAIAHTQAEIIVTTDADCYPLSRFWLASLVSYLVLRQAVFVTSGVMISPVRNVFEGFQALDLAGMMLTTGASVRYRLGDMCNGGNLAYRKSAFEAVGGFEGIEHLASGDDMLLMGKMRRHFPEQIHFLKCKDSLVATAAPTTIRQFVTQRVRWASKSNSYSQAILPMILLLVWTSNVALLVATLAAIWQQSLAIWRCVGLAWGIKMLADVVYLYTACRFLDKTTWLRYFLPAQIGHVLYIGSVGILANMGSYEWKGRRVR